MGPSHRRGADQACRPCASTGHLYVAPMQVLGAWKQLQDSKQACVLAAMEGTGWRARARQALAHPKQLVVSAASKLLGPLEGGTAGEDVAGLVLDAVELQACLQQLSALEVRPRGGQ